MDHTVAALSNNRGATLIIGLLTLVLLTLIGIAATSTSRMEVQIAGNDKMFKEAFYAAEFGLTNGENTLEELLSRVDLDEGSVPGHYGQGTQDPWRPARMGQHRFRAGASRRYAQRYAGGLAAALYH